MRNIRKEQFSGCLIGQALGDALGFPMEGYPPDECARYVKEILRADRVGEISRASFPFGQYTDDTQLAREFLQSYVEQKGFDPADYAKRIAAIFRENRIVGRGIATDQAARRLNQGVPWDKAGTPPPSAGNGTAMRAAPVGMLFYDDAEQLIQAAHDQGRITHTDPRCSAGSVAMAGAVALVLTSESIEVESFLRQLSEWSGRFDSTTAEGLLRLIDWLSLPPDKAIEFISPYGQDPQLRDGWEGISPFVTSSVLWSLYAFLKTPHDYWETVCTAIVVGGDVDTTAAMAGAISGAFLGIEAIPGELARKLTDQWNWGYEQLKELAEQSYRTKFGERE